MPRHIDCLFAYIGQRLTRDACSAAPGRAYFARRPLYGATGNEERRHSVEFALK